MTRYAQNTDVSPERSRQEIERILTRYGATAFMYGWDEEGKDGALVQFKANDRYIRFLLPLPSRDDPEFQRTPARRQKRSLESALAAWEQACKQRWRALALCIKAKLEAVECGIAEFDEEFLAHIVLPDNTRVGDRLRPLIANAYLSGQMPRMLPEWNPEDEAIDGEIVQ